jgi:hypothetical protein
MVGVRHGGPVTSATTASTDRPAVELDEHAVAVAVLAGDREAFRLLVDRESAAVIRACYRSAISTRPRTRPRRRS